MIKIKEAENGWIVQQYGHDLDDKVYVFSCDDTEKDVVNVFTQVLRKIHDLMGPMLSHKRIRIEVKNGDKK